MMEQKPDYCTWERNQVSLLNWKGWELTWCGGDYSYFDAFGKTLRGVDCVVELKLRHAYYPTKILEKAKYDKLMADGRLAFYYVFDSKASYLYQLDSLTMPRVQTSKLRHTTYFKDNKPIEKEFYLLPEDQASIIYYR